MKQILIILILTFTTISCSEKIIQSKPKDTQYIIDVVYVYDDALPTFNSSIFLSLFRDRIPYLTKQTLGYDVVFNVKTGITEKEFYNMTKRVLQTNLSVLSDSHVNVFDITDDELENVLINTVSNTHPFRIDYLFGTSDVDTIVDHYAKNNINNIRSIYNMKLSNRDKLFQNEYPFVNRAFYWAMISASYRSADMVIINMPIVSLNKKMDAKSIADYGFVDRIVSENLERVLGVNAVVTTYPLISSDSLFDSIRKSVAQDIQTEIFSYYIVQTIAMMLGGYGLLENEPYSIMNEVVGFEYETWYSNIKSATNLIKPYKLLKTYPYSYSK